MRKFYLTIHAIVVAAALMIASTTLGVAAQYTLSISGSDAIFLAGRTDVTIPAASDPWTGPPGGYLTRHAYPTPEEILETFPPFIPVAAGDIIRVADPAVGGISFYNGYGGTIYGPDGNELDGSDLESLAGISGYRGPQGPLAGVFLDNNVPSSGPAPATLDFGPGGLGRDFATLSPLLGQVFYIGNGVTSSDIFQEFVAPGGATRLFLGIPDGFGFVGHPGAYDDNDGAYRVIVGVNQTPSVPDSGSALALLGVAFAGLAILRRRLERAV
jgi:hypothetical protein